MRRLVLVLMVLVPAVAAARGPVLERARAAYGFGAALDRARDELVLAFVNETDAPIELPIRVRSHVIDHDWLTVVVEGATMSAQLAFISPRERAARETVTIAPHASVIERVDLGGRLDLPPGEYTVRVQWDDKVATTTLSIPYGCALAHARDEGLPASPSTPASTRATSTPTPPARMPVALGALLVLGALLAAAALAKRAGTAAGCVPCSAP